MSMKWVRIYIFGDYNHYGVMLCRLFPSIKTLPAYRSLRRLVVGRACKKTCKGFAKRDLQKAQKRFFWVSEFISYKCVNCFRITYYSVRRGARVLRHHAGRHRRLLLRGLQRPQAGERRAAHGRQAGMLFNAIGNWRYRLMIRASSEYSNNPNILI